MKSRRVSCKETRRPVWMKMPQPLPSSSSSSAIFFKWSASTMSAFLQNKQHYFKFKTRSFYSFSWLYKWHFCFYALGVQLFRFPEWCRSIQNKKSILLEMLSDFEAFCCHDCEGASSVCPLLLPWLTALTLLPPGWKIIMYLHLPNSSFHYLF